MTSESQNIEFKVTWRDGYLKWICGFANASGGKLFIGVDDKGKVTGIDNYNKLLEELLLYYLEKILGNSIRTLRLRLVNLGKQMPT